MNSLIIAIKSGIPEEVNAVLERFGTDLINKLEPQVRQPPLYFAAIHADHEKAFLMTSLLIERGSNPAFQDSLNQSILFYVCRDGKQRIFDLLISLKVELDLPDIYGQTPLYYACRQNHLDIVRRLLDHGALLDRVDNIKQQTPLFYAAREGHLEMCKLLLQRGANVAHTDSDNKTAVQYARKYGKVEVQELLTQELNKVKEGGSKGKGAPVKEEVKPVRKAKENQPKVQVRLLYTDDKGNSREVTENELKELGSSLGRVYEYLQNPQRIDGAEMETQLSQPCWQKNAMKVLNVCWKARGSNLFHKPVNPAEYGIMDYFQIIRHPMDFSLVKAKLTHNVYTEPEEFKADMALVFDNCVLYNGLENEVAKIAIEIKALFHEQCKAQGL